MMATKNARASEGFTFECVIDGQNYSRDQLARLQYSRDLHVLHELKRMGAPVALHGDVLSHDDINRLVAEDASSVSVTTRTSYDPDGIRHLFKEQLATSEQFWREMNAASEGQPLQPCVAELTITGIPFDQFHKYVQNMAPFLQGYAQCNPDHFFIYPDEGSLRGVEIFGMYGGPTEVQLTPDPDVSVPIERDHTYPLSFKGAATLPDGTNANVPAFHQFKPLDEGLVIKAGCAFPAAAPAEMVAGHALHSAIEFLGFTKFVYVAESGSE